MVGTAQARLCPPYEATLRRHSHGPHPEETAKRSSRRMAAGEIGATWFETALTRLLTMRIPLLRRDLARRRRRVDEVGGELGVADLGVLHRLLLHRAVATDAVRQR